MFLILVDGHSVWPEVIEMVTASSINVLQQLFARHRLPEQLVSQEFERFTKSNGIKHIRTTPYHPSSNGLAERFLREKLGLVNMMASHFNTDCQTFS